MCTVQICTKANIHVNRVKSLPATCAMLSVKLICQPKSFGQGCGGNGGTSSGGARLQRWWVECFHGEVDPAQLG